jgi:hypothetical protein
MNFFFLISIIFIKKKKYTNGIDKIKKSLFRLKWNIGYFRKLLIKLGKCKFKFNRKRIIWEKIFCWKCWGFRGKKLIKEIRRWGWGRRIRRFFKKETIIN